MWRIIIVLHGISLRYSIGVGFDPLCGFPAIPDHAQIEGFSWNFPEAFEEGSQVIFSCLPGFDWLGKKIVKTCSENGTWVGKDIQCYEKMVSPYTSFIVNASETYDGSDPVVYNKELVGEIQFVMNQIYSIGFIGIHFPFHVSELHRCNRSCWPEVYIGKENCIPEMASNDSSGHLQLKYLCLSKTTKNFLVFISQLTIISNVTVYHLPKTKCTGRPGIPLNAVAAMVGPGTVHYRCEGGFILKGNRTTSCQSDSGQWLPHPPQCEMVSPRNGSGGIGDQKGAFAAIGTLLFLVFVAIVILGLAVVIIFKRFRSVDEKRVRHKEMDNFKEERTCGKMTISP